MKLAIVLFASMLAAQAQHVDAPSKPGLPHTCGASGNEPCPPGAAPPEAKKDEVVPLKLQDKADVLELQKQIQNSELAAYQLAQKLEEANKASVAIGNLLDKKLNALRKTYGLPEDSIFDPDKLTLTKPAPAPEKK